MQPGTLYAELNRRAHAAAVHLLRPPDAPAPASAFSPSGPAAAASAAASLEASDEGLSVAAGRTVIGHRHARGGDIGLVLEELPIGFRPGLGRAYMIPSPLPPPPRLPLPLHAP